MTERGDRQGVSKTGTQRLLLCPVSQLAHPPKLEQGDTIKEKRSEDETHRGGDCAVHTASNPSQSRHSLDYTPL
jgi:hypothetical protein